MWQWRSQVSMGFILPEVALRRGGLLGCGLCAPRCPCYNTRMTYPEGIEATERGNPITQAAYRRQVRLQVYLPLGLGLILVGVVAYLVGRSGLAAASTWADASLALLLLPFLPMGLLLAAVLAAGVYGLGRLIQWLPGPARQGHALGVRVASQVRRVSDGVVRPLLLLRAASAGLVTGWRMLLSIFRSE